MSDISESYHPNGVETTHSDNRHTWTHNDLHFALEKEQLAGLDTSRLPPDVESLLLLIQKRQEAENGLINLKRLTPFIDAMKAIETLGLSDMDASPVWNSLKYILHHVRQDPRVFDQLLDAYQSLGRAMPLPEQTTKLSATQHGSDSLLHRMYSEILGFHGTAAGFFVQPEWKSLIRPLWKDFMHTIDTIVTNLGKITVQLNNTIAAVESTRSLTSMNGYGAQPPIIQVHHHDHQHVAGNLYKHIALDGQSSAIIGNAGSGIDEHKLDQLLRELDQAQAELKKQEETRRSEQIFNITKWLAASSAEDFQKQAFGKDKRHENTGEWILAHEKIKPWMMNEHSRNLIIWLQGIPGAGKTVLASVIINACQQIEGSDTIYFYSKHDGVDNTGTPITVLKGLLKQLLYLRPGLAPFMDEQRRVSGEPELRTFSRARKVLEPAIRSTRRLYIVLDGIDECNGKDDSGIGSRNELLKFLIKLVHEADGVQCGQMRLLVVSQNESDIRQTLSSAEEIELTAKDNERDIKSFVVDMAEKIRTKFRLNHEESQAIALRICSTAHGQFLYARLVAENLHNQVTPNDLRKELRNFGIPPDLESAYQRIVCRIKEQNNKQEWKYAKQLLGWMCRALRSLSRHELQGARMVDCENERIDPDLRIFVAFEKLCGVLISVVNDRISLVHSTAKLFITTSPHIDAFVVDCEMTVLCLRYLTFDIFDLHVEQQDNLSRKSEQAPKTEEEQRIERQLGAHVLSGDFAFAEYAIAKWPHHIRQLVNHINELPTKEGGMWEDLLRLAKNTEIEEGSLAQVRLQKLSDVCDIIEEFLLQHDIDATGMCTSATYNECLGGRQSLELLTELGAEENFKTILLYDDLHRQRGMTFKATPSLRRLELSLASWRQCLEGLAGKKGNKHDIQVLNELYGERLYRCSRINCYYFTEGYPTRGSRNQHHTRHDRPYQCAVEECQFYGDGFTIQSKLDRHVATCHPDDDSKRKMFDAIPEHEPPKPTEYKFHCAICDKHFSRGAILKSHQLVHAGQRPYECSTCGRAFTRKNDCTRHEKGHSRGR